MKYKFILENHEDFRLGKMCQILDVSRSGYHSYLKRKFSQRQIENQKLLEKIKQIYDNFLGRYGSPRIYDQLRKEGINCNRKRVARIMKINEIRAKTKRKYKVTTDSDHDLPVAENLLQQDFSSTEVNKKWVSDITYIWTNEGWLYLVCILDLASRLIVSWSLESRLKSSLVISALLKAVESRAVNTGLIFHSDRGSQYASNEVRAFLSEHNMIQSMSRKGNCYDNAVMESFFHTLKSEMVSFEKFRTREEAKMKIFEYIEIFYNRKRSHSSIGYLSPFEFENKIKLKLVA
jgi:transposase InsO family protein